MYLLKYLKYILKAGLFKKMACQVIFRTRSDDTERTKRSLRTKTFLVFNQRILKWRKRFPNHLPTARQTSFLYHFPGVPDKFRAASVEPLQDERAVHIAREKMYAHVLPIKTVYNHQDAEVNETATGQFMVKLWQHRIIIKLFVSRMIFSTGHLQSLHASIFTFLL